MSLSNLVSVSAIGSGHFWGTHLLDVRDLNVDITADSGAKISALQEIGFHIAAGEVVGLLGESGAGKTTLALALLRLLSPQFQIVRGSIQFESRSLLSLDDRELRKTRGARISVIYQDSTVLNPVMRVGDQVVEVLRAHRDWSKQRCREEVRILLEEVGIEEVDRVYRSYPHQLSGGQRQRVVIAQALVCSPALVIADEPTSSLDTVTAASIIELLGRLNRQFKIAFLIISHQIEILERLADRVIVMHCGRIVEQGPCRQVLHEPLHPYTRALLSCTLPAVSARDAPLARSSLSTIAGGEAREPLASHQCNFEGRCADRMRICAMEAPREVEAADAQMVSCFKYGNA